MITCRLLDWSARELAVTVISLCIVFSCKHSLPCFAMPRLDLCKLAFCFASWLRISSCQASRGARRKGKAEEEKGICSSHMLPVSAHLVPVKLLPGAAPVPSGGSNWMQVVVFSSLSRTDFIMPHAERWQHQPSTAPSSEARGSAQQGTPPFLF